MSWRSIGALFIVVLFACAPARAGDDDDWGSERTFEGEPGDWRPLDSMPDEAMPKESMPQESMPLDGRVDSRLTDSEEDDCAAVAPRPREMMDIGEGDGDHHHKPRHDELKEAVPVDDDGVQPAPRAVEPMGKGPTD